MKSVITSHSYILNYRSLLQGFPFGFPFAYIVAHDDVISGSGDVHRSGPDGVHLNGALGFEPLVFGRQTVLCHAGRRGGVQLHPIARTLATWVGGAFSGILDRKAFDVPQTLTTATHGLLV